MFTNGTSESCVHDGNFTAPLPPPHDRSCSAAAADMCEATPSTALRRAASGVGPPPRGGSPKGAGGMLRVAGRGVSPRPGCDGVWADGLQTAATHAGGRARGVHLGVVAFAEARSGHAGVWAGSMGLSSRTDGLDASKLFQPR
mmetsp:Transcript_18124/g.46364  ORF Transcript_18124/g.46364 Transcript_18124/m.46364 type:complete len:143 (+) Transcript_18124:983-1411(+)